MDIATAEDVINAFVTIFGERMDHYYFKREHPSVLERTRAEMEVLAETYGRIFIMSKTDAYKFLVEANGGMD